jgi:uncharacterized protein YdeI (YjbR/CyaY-like superfamily)
MSAKAFASQREFRKWLQANHASTRELVVRCYKVHAREKGLTYREALDEALCFGWIDGVRRSADGDSFTTRFTPRKPRSKWSAINIRRAKELEAEGRMHEAGLRAFAARDAGSSKRYSFEEKPSQLDPASLKAFRTNRRAWMFFRAQAPWYQRTSIFWVMDAKKEETRARRLAELIAHSARGEPIKVLDRRPRRLD